jgi:dephospho-CoA kinase
LEFGKYSKIDKAKIERGTIMSLVIGLTGGIASGKSTVSRMLLELNIPVIDADVEARNVVEIGEKAYQQIINTFGHEILLDNGEINRTKLGGIVFHDEEKRMQLNSIVHPAVRERMNSLKEQLIMEGKQAIILDIPLLFESKLTHMVEKTILVYVKRETQLQRLIERNQLTEDEANARINSQMPLDDKLTLADKVIDNNGTLAHTKEQLFQILTEWKVL